MQVEDPNPLQLPEDIYETTAERIKTSGRRRNNIEKDSPSTSNGTVGHCVESVKQASPFAGNKQGRSRETHKAAVTSTASKASQGESMTNSKQSSTKDGFGAKGTVDEGEPVSSPQAVGRGSKPKAVAEKPHSPAKGRRAKSKANQAELTSVVKGRRMRGSKQVQEESAESSEAIKGKDNNLAPELSARGRSSRGKVVPATNSSEVTLNRRDSLSSKRRGRRAGSGKEDQTKPAMTDKDTEELTNTCEEPKLTSERDQNEPDQISSFAKGKRSRNTTDKAKEEGFPTGRGRRNAAKTDGETAMVKKEEKETKPLASVRGRRGQKITEAEQTKQETVGRGRRGNPKEEEVETNAEEPSAKSAKIKKEPVKSGPSSPAKTSTRSTRGKRGTKDKKQEEEENEQPEVSEQLATAARGRRTNNVRTSGKPQQDADIESPEDTGRTKGRDRGSKAKRVSSSSASSTASSRTARSSNSSAEMIVTSDTKQPASRKRKNVFDSPEISLRLKLSGGSVSSSGSRTDLDLTQDTTLQGSPSLRRAALMTRHHRVLFTGYQSDKENHIVSELGEFDCKINISTILFKSKATSTDYFVRAWVRPSILTVTTPSACYKTKIPPLKYYIIA